MFLKCITFIFQHLNSNNPRHYYHNKIHVMVANWRTNFYMIFPFRLYLLSLLICIFQFLFLLLALKSHKIVFSYRKSIKSIAYKQQKPKNTLDVQKIRIEKKVHFLKRWFFLFDIFTCLYNCNGRVWNWIYFFSCGKCLKLNFNIQIFFTELIAITTYWCENKVRYICIDTKDCMWW